MELEKAKDLFRQAVYHSRQARFPAEQGLCGLGGGPSPAGVELLAALDVPPTLRPAAVLPLLDDWLRAKDKFDRERNHFLKRFRNEHGFDRRQYDAATAKAFDDGLDDINGREEAGLVEHARRLADA